LNAEETGQYEWVPIAVEPRYVGADDVRWDAVVRRLAPFLPSALIERLVVLSPHPDDETLGVGGLIAASVSHKWEVVVVSVTDGEAARCAVPDLGDRRHRELLDALDRLRPGLRTEVVRCRLPDGAVQNHGSDLRDVFTRVIRSSDLVVAPLSCDGHSDHDAVAQAGAGVARQAGATFAMFPIWAWQWHDPATSPISLLGRRVLLSDDDLTRKNSAIACYVSQTSGSEAIVPPSVLRRFQVGYEVLVGDEGQSYEG
jgi:LmbE family N-acetylglucosaminyl deacetylase